MPMELEHIKLSDLLGFWHPRYRRLVVRVAVSTVLTGVFVFVYCTFLNWTTDALGRAEPATVETGALGMVHRAAAGLHVPVSVCLLVLLMLSWLLISFLNFWHAIETKQMTVRSQMDLEQLVLENLLRKDDRFFSRHSPAEALNRLGTDLLRLVQHRATVTQIWWYGILIATNLAFFVAADWRLAAVAALGVAGGASWARAKSARVKQTDAQVLRYDDQFKTRFEEFLRALPEVQVSRPHRAIRAQVGALQGERGQCLLRFGRLSELLQVGKDVAHISTFTTMIGVVFYLRATGSTSTFVGLIPVIVSALPIVFKHTQGLMEAVLSGQLAEVSAKRLLEYEAVEDVEAAPTGRPLAAAGEQAGEIRLRDVSYCYATDGGGVRTGISGVTLAFPAGQWTAIVGPAGCGKSTLLKLILGRVPPTEGEICWGDRPLGQLAAEDRAALFALMPQSPALFQGSILMNLRFGRPDDGAASGAAFPCAEDVAALEDAGLGQICRLKALDLTFDDPGALRPQAMGELRQAARRRLAEACGIQVTPFEAGGAAPQHWVVEQIMGGRCDPPRALALLLGRRAARALHPLHGSPLEQRLLAQGRDVLRGVQQLLHLGSCVAYNQLAPVALEEPVWRLRAQHAFLGDREPANASERAALLLIALTSRVVEVEPRAEPWSEQTSCLEPLRELLGDAFQPFVLERVHPLLTWRENVIFGGAEAPNSRVAAAIDRTLLDFLIEEGWRDALTRVGLGYDIGRAGSNLSGGEGQLVALCRALLRRTPVLVLDEPTSALDPARRARVAELLTHWKRDRAILTVSHDPEFVREADRVVLLDAGRVVAVGSFAELSSTSETFRSVLRQA